MTDERVHFLAFLLTTPNDGAARGTDVKVAVSIVFKRRVCRGRYGDLC